MTSPFKATIAHFPHLGFHYLPFGPPLAALLLPCRFHAASILLPCRSHTASILLPCRSPASPDRSPHRPHFSPLSPHAPNVRASRFFFSPQTVMHLGTSGPNWISCGVKEKQENHSCILSIDVTRREATRLSNLNFHVSSWEKRGKLYRNSGRAYQEGIAHWIHRHPH